MVCEEATHATRRERLQYSAMLSHAGRRAYRELIPPSNVMSNTINTESGNVCVFERAGELCAFGARVCRFVFGGRCRRCYAHITYTHIW